MDKSCELHFLKQLLNRLKLLAIAVALLLYEAQRQKVCLEKW